MQKRSNEGVLAELSKEFCNAPNALVANLQGIAELNLGDVEHPNEIRGLIEGTKAGATGPSKGLRSPSQGASYVVRKSWQVDVVEPDHVRGWRRDQILRRELGKVVATKTPPGATHPEAG
jgi:hypothetical protein